MIRVDATYYGWYDNTPPGCATAYTGCAGGTGTYSDPITFASDPREFPVGTILYYPTIEKYVAMGDLCQECSQDWSGRGPDGGPHLYHVDLWLDGRGGNAFDVINCEDALTQELPNGTPVLTPFLLDPPTTEPVSTEPLFDPTTEHCFGGATSAATHGRYQNQRTHECLTESGAAGGQVAATAPCGPTRNEDLEFNGAFFIVRGRCLTIEGSGLGAVLDFQTCTGNDRQQFEINPNGTIAWIQYTDCVTPKAGRVELATCQASTSNRWSFTSEGRA